MKKIIAITLSAAMVLSMTACGGKKVDAKALYQDAVKKNAELTAMDMSLDTSIKMTAGEQTMDMNMKVDMKVDQVNTEKMVYFADTTTTSDGQTSSANVFYTDGYYYMDSDGQKYKYKMDLTELMKQVQDSVDNNLDVEMLKELTAEKDGDNQVLTFTADPEKMDSYLQEVMGSIGATAGLEGMTMTINSSSGSYTINKDGYYTNMDVKMEIELSMNGQTAKMEMEMIAVVNNPGQPVEITLPGTDGYEEIDPALLSQAA